MKMSREDIKAWSEIIKTIFGIGAVIVGAYWALFLYTKKDAPILEPRFKPSYEISWHNTDDKCLASIRVGLENTGAASYRIDRVHVQGWIFEKVDEKIGNIDYFELDKVKQDKDRFFDRTYSKPGEITFIRQFPPQTGTSHDFQWTFPKDNRWVYFNVDFYKPGDELPQTYTGTWSKICG